LDSRHGCANFGFGALDPFLPQLQLGSEQST
jgi:hypothetical protein